MQGKRDGQGGLDRRGFVKTVGLGVGSLAALGPAAGDAAAAAGAVDLARAFSDPEWPSLKRYDGAHLARIALPIGGIGTGTVSLGGRGDLRDFELMNRPGKGFVPTAAAAPFFALRLREPGRPPVARVLEGPLPADVLEGSHGSPAPNAGLPRFRAAAFAAAYPFGRVLLTDPDLPVEAHLKAMNPLVPADAEASGLPIAVFRVELRNRSAQPVEAAVCASLPNFVGMDGSKTKRDWKGDPQVLGAAGNRNAVAPHGRRPGALPLVGEGRSDGPGVGLARPGRRHRRHRPRPARAGPRAVGRGRSSISGTTSWPTGASTSERPAATDTPDGLARGLDRSRPRRSRARPSSSSPGTSPTAYSWTPKSDPPGPDDCVGNHYTTQFADAWDVAEKALPRLPELHRRTLAFVSAFAASDLPAEVKEAALFNLSHAAHPDLLPHRRRPLLRLGGLRATPPAAATARAPTSGTTSRRRRSCSARSRSVDARGRVRPRHRATRA